MPKRNRIPPMKQPAPQPKTKDLAVTKEQIAGFKIRQQAIDIAISNLNTFLSGVVAGHGYDAVEVKGFDEANNIIRIAVAE